jgi:hypothetical protein
MSLAEAFQRLQLELDRHEAKVEDLAKSNTFRGAEHAQTQLALSALRTDVAESFAALHRRLNRFDVHFGIDTNGGDFG